MAISDSVGVLFRIKADADQAKREIAEVKGGLGGLDNAAVGASGGIASMVNPVTLVTVGIAAMAAASLAGVKALYSLTESAAKFGGEIYDAQVKTGLTAATLSTLKLNADNAGSSFEQITGSVVKFSQLLGQAKQGNEKAIETLTKYGVTATTTDGALQQAIASIAKMEDADQRAAAAKELFRDKAADLLPVIDQMSGDLKAATKEAERLGIQVSEKNIRAADAFGDQMGVLNAQLAAAGRTIGFALMPELTKMANYLSEFLARNQAQIANVGDRIATVFSRMIGGFNAIKNWVENNQGVIRVALALLTAGGSELAIAGTKAMVGLVDRMSSGRNVAPQSQEYAGQSTAGYTVKDDPEALKAAADKRKAERQAERDRELNALQDNIKLRIKAETDQFDKIQDEWETAFIEKRETEETWRAESEKNFAIYTAKVKKMLLDAFKLDAIGKTPTEIENLRLGKDSANNSVDKYIVKSREDREKTITGVIKEEIKEREKDDKDWWAYLKESQDVQGDEYLAQVKAWADQVTKDMAMLALLPSVPLDVPTLSTEGSGQKAGLFDSFKNSWLEFFDLVSGTAPTLGSMLGDIAGMLQEAFSGFANALGSVVENFVLMGTTGPAFIKKILAASLASIAAESAVRAIFELAKGFASLFFNPAEAAAHFQAAALFGSIAVGSGLAGRAIAGDSFAQQTSGGGASDSGGQSQGGSSYTSGQFGGFGNRLNNTLAAVEEGINTLTNKVRAMRPGEVLGMGVDENPNALSDGLISGLQNNSRITGAVKRAMGDAR